MVKDAGPLVPVSTTLTSSSTGLLWVHITLSRMYGIAFPGLYSFTDCFVI